MVASSSKAANNSTKSSGVRVYCRVRPLLEDEERSCLEIKEEEIVYQGKEGHRFQYEKVFDERSTQSDVFEGVRGKEIVRDVLRGYNGTLFAYGQTNAGKTHTIQGESLNDGIIGRAGQALFEGVADSKESIEYAIKVSFVEIYQERIRDLLDSYSEVSTSLQIREDKLRGIYVKDCTEIFVTNLIEFIQVVKRGIKNRVVAATGMNTGSSRSHSALTITVTQEEDETMKEGKLVFVDLAGSEMLKKSLATGQQLEEAKKINKSLSALANVIFALTDDASSHIPYRDSKLTRMLQDSLGGNAKTALILCISKASYNAQETLSTLRFGARAKKVKNTPKINEQKSLKQLQSLLAKAEAAIDLQASYIKALELKKEKQVNNDDAAALTSLHTQFAALNEQVEDERSEAHRQHTEVKRLTRLLEDKDKQIADYTDLLQEARKAVTDAVSQASNAVADRDSAIALAEARAFQIEEKELELQKLRATLLAQEKMNEKDKKEDHDTDTTSFCFSDSATIKQNDSQRIRLVEDLQKCQQRLSFYQDQTSNSFTTHTKEEVIKHERSLQQRMQQLVAVHRQLLRKFASLEIHLADANKKIRLRDERIAHLELSRTRPSQLDHLKSDIIALDAKLNDLLQLHKSVTNSTANAVQHRIPSFALRTLRGGTQAQQSSSQDDLPPSSFFSRIRGSSS